MSLIQDDKEVVQGKQNRKALKGIEASLRDQVQKKLYKKLKDLDVGSIVSKIWTDGNSDRNEWLKRQQMFLDDLDVFVNEGANGPFEGSSSLHIPMPLTACKALHARFLQSIYGIEPPFNAKPRRPDSIERTQLMQDVMQYTIKDWANNYQGIEKTIDYWIWAWVTTGCGILKRRWDCQYEIYSEVKQVPEYAAPKIQRDAEGNEVVIPQMKLVEREFEVTKKIFEGPIADYVFNEDLLIIGGGGDPQLADSVHHRVAMTASELWTLADRGIFDADTVKEIVEGGKDHLNGMEGNDIKNQRHNNAGLNDIDSESRLDRYNIIESYMSVDVTDSGINSKVVVWTHERSRKLLHANYLRRMNKAGEVPFHKIDFHIRPGEAYGIGLLEMLHPLSVELDAMHNMRVDNGIMTNMPVGFYRASSSIDPKTIPYSPGTLIPLDDPQRDIYFPTFSNRTAYGFQEESALYTVVERLTGVNDMITGAMTGAQGATRTATGARALLSESSANLDVFLRRLQRGFRGYLKGLSHDVQERIPKGLAFRVTGEGGNDYFAQVREQEDIAGDWDFEMSANSSTSNPAIQQERTSQVYQSQLNPLLIQMGVANPSTIYTAYKEWLKGLGVKDWAAYAQKPPQYMTNLTPEDEANRILRGIPVPVTPEMDHAGFMAYFEEIFGSDELLGQFTEEQAKALAVQNKQHEQMLQALEAQAAQMANSQQMQMNQAQSQQQASPGMNPMAGGNPNGVA